MERKLVKNIAPGALCFIALACLAACAGKEGRSGKGEQHKGDADENKMGKVYYYEPAVSTIEGVMCKKAVWGMEHEDDPEPRDTILVIALKEKITVMNAPGVDTTAEDTPPNEYNVDTIQLTAAPQALYKAVGQVMKLKGTFFHSINGHHFTDVLLDVKGESMDGLQVSKMK